MVKHYHKKICKALSEICNDNKDKFLGGSTKKKIERENLFIYF